MANKNCVRLTVVFDDGREISGVYGYLEARARMEAAPKFLGYLYHKMDFEMADESAVI